MRKPLIDEDELEAGFRALALYEAETGLDHEALDWCEGLLESFDDDDQDTDHFPGASH